jgi:ferrous iron transport protein A
LTISLPLSVIRGALDSSFREAYPEIVLQLSVNNQQRESGLEEDCHRSLLELSEGEQAVLDSLDLPADISHRLMELGFIPGLEVTAVRSAPSGDPRVFRVDGSEFALRRETARHIRLRGH